MSRTIVDLRPAMRLLQVLCPYSEYYTGQFEEGECLPMDEIGITSIVSSMFDESELK
jgi:hypothetical protein